MENPSYNSQIRQLRILAEAALTRYDIGSARLTLLSHHEHTLFRVDSAAWPGSVSGEELETGEVVGTIESGEKQREARYVLRLCDPRYASQEALSSELQWLAALRRDTDLCVPEPVPARDGSLLAKVKIEDIVEERLCLLLRWVPGRFVTSGLTPTLFERVGIFHARLHQHARHFNPPEGFIRPHWDWEWLSSGAILDPALLEGAQRRDGIIGDDEIALFSAVTERIRQVVSAVPKNSNYYGLVHGDLQQTNYLFYKGNVNAIGFNNCCWNYYLFDMVVTLSCIEGREDEEQMRQAYVRGYEVVRVLPAQYEEKLAAFTAFYKLQQIQTLLHPVDRAVQGDRLASLAAALGWLERYIAVDVSHR